MHSRAKLTTLATLIILSLFSFSLSGKASELADIEKQYAELKLQFERDFESFDLLLPVSITDSQKCIDSYAGAINAEDVSARDACQVALTRFRAEQNRLRSVIEVSKAELAALELRIQSLRSTNASASNSGVTSSTGSGASTNNSQSSTNVSPEPKTSSASNQIEPSLTDNPTPIQSSPSQQQGATSANQSVDTATPIPPTVVNKPNPSPKPTVKKRTIICVKGKTIRKVIAVKPVCPKGFKLKKK